jgi:hypothetical protein
MLPLSLFRHRCLGLCLFRASRRVHWRAAAGILLGTVPIVTHAQSIGMVNLGANPVTLRLTSSEFGTGYITLITGADTICGTAAQTRGPGSYGTVNRLKRVSSRNWHNLKLYFVFRQPVTAEENETVIQRTSYSYRHLPNRSLRASPNAWFYKLGFPDVALQLNPGFATLYFQSLSGV